MEVYNPITLALYLCSRAYFTQQSKRFHNSYLDHQILREDCCINVHCDSIIVCKTIILVMSYAEFFKVDFNGLDLFILLMHIPVSYQVHICHVIRTYDSYCFIFEVGDLCIALSLTLLPLKTFGTWIHNFYNT